MRPPRHRAFPIVHEASGTARIFSCKYHGWSYDLSGNLTKAPRFTPDSVPGFDPSDVRLFPIHTHVDSNGFVYANLDARPEPEISWKQQYGELDRQDVLVNSGVDWDAVEYDFTWTKDGNFNWKLMQDNYNEVQVLPSPASTTHQLISTATVLSLPHRPPVRRQNHSLRHILRRPRLSRHIHLPLQRAQSLRLFHLQLRHDSLRRPVRYARLSCGAFQSQPRHRLYAFDAQQPLFRNDHAARIRRVPAQHGPRHSRSPSTND